MTSSLEMPDLGYEATARQRVRGRTPEGVQALYRKVAEIVTPADIFFAGLRAGGPQDQILNFVAADVQQAFWTVSCGLQTRYGS